MAAPESHAPNPVEPHPSSGSLRHRVRRLMPFGSLAVGVVSALMMDRGPRRGVVVAVCAVLVWFTLLAFAWLPRLQEGVSGQRQRWLLGVLRRSSLMATQSMLQLTLFFALPFYWQAATMDEPGHVLFMALLFLLSVCTLWDPLTARLLARPLLAALLPACGSFVALCAVLPGLGFSTRESLWLAAAAAGAGTLLVAAGGAAPAVRKAVSMRAFLVAVALGAVLCLGGGRIVPAAPLRLVSAAIGTRLDGRDLVDPAEAIAGIPERLICATAIWSPMGVRDRLFHVWRKDGVLRARIKLEIRGGRGEGYRTHSMIQNLGKGAQGGYRCSVETETGQVLGSARMRVGNGPGVSGP